MRLALRVCDCKVVRAWSRWKSWQQIRPPAVGTYGAWVCSWLQHLAFTISRAVSGLGRQLLGPGVPCYCSGQLQKHSDLVCCQVRSGSP
jgi:hypothetical protein